MEKKKIELILQPNIQKILDIEEGYELFLTSITFIDNKIIS